MEIIETKYGFWAKCSREEFEKIKEVIEKALNNEQEERDKIPSNLSSV